MLPSVCDQLLHLHPIFLLKTGNECLLFRHRKMLSSWEILQLDFLFLDNHTNKIFLDLHA